MHAVIWDGPTVQDLGTPGGARSQAFDVNQAGQVVGWADTSAAGPRGFLWSDTQGMVDLGVLPDSPSVTAGAINSLGQIVGHTGGGGGYPEHAFVWESGVIRQITSQADHSAALDINDSGTAWERSGSMRITRTPVPGMSFADASRPGDAEPATINDDSREGCLQAECVSRRSDLRELHAPRIKT
jgi:probable HAF family extracellular repeat protein